MLYFLSQDPYIFNEMMQEILLYNPRVMKGIGSGDGEPGVQLKYICERSNNMLLAVKKLNSTSRVNIVDIVDSQYGTHSDLSNLY